MSGQMYGCIEPPRTARTLGLSMASEVVCIAGVFATFVMVMVLDIPIWVAGGALVVAAAGVVFLETGKRERSRRLRSEGVAHLRTQANMADGAAEQGDNR